MRVQDLQPEVHEKLYEAISSRGFDELRPAQTKACAAGVHQGKNVLVCTPTASGKTFIAELALMQAVLAGGKGVYIVPLKALAYEKYHQFKEHYGHLCKVALSVGDRDSAEERLADQDIIITTSEKLDSVLRHKPRWLEKLSSVVIDEIHLLHDAGRGPTLEIVITLLRHVLPNVQLVGLSATIGNPKELAGWLDANLVEDDWRPVPLHQGIAVDGKVQFY